MSINAFDSKLNLVKWLGVWADFSIRCPHSSANYRYGHLESNALTGIEIGEFHSKLKNLEFRSNSIFWESLGAIWIDSMSLGVVPPLSFFFVFF